MNYRVNTSFVILTNNCNFKVINLLISKKKDSNAAHLKCLLKINDCALNYDLFKGFNNYMV